MNILAKNLREIVISIFNENSCSLKKKPKPVHECLLAAQFLKVSHRPKQPKRSSVRGKADGTAAGRRTSVIPVGTQRHLHGVTLSGRSHSEISGTF